MFQDSDIMSNYANYLYKDYEELELKNNKLTKENKFLLLRATIAEDEQRRLEHVVAKKAMENDALKKEMKFKKRNRTFKRNSKS